MKLLFIIKQHKKIKIGDCALYQALLQPFINNTKVGFREINKCDNCNDKIIKKKPTKVQKCKYLCAIFGYKIAKQLNKPVQITLNTE